MSEKQKELYDSLVNLKDKYSILNWWWLFIFPPKQGHKNKQS